MQISFHGADRGVTGSCHHIEIAGTHLLIDCGLFQGTRELEEDNAAAFGFEPAQIDMVLLTHAHLDHCGRLPLLVARGFRGEIVATAPTRELTELVLRDAAHLQEEDARYRAHRAARGGHPHRAEDDIAPLYAGADVDRTLERFKTVARYDHRLQLAKGLHATYLDAGHILGSASILLELEDGPDRKRVLFSGDLGSRGRPILPDPAEAPWADVVVMETTYGDRLHRALQPSVAELYGVVRDTFARGGNVMIPTFALERAQELLFFLREGVASGQLPQPLQVFLDSPMAVSATEIFGRHRERFNAATAALFDAGRDPFHVPGLKMTRTAEQSMAINEITSGAIILAGAGMCSGGRIRHHLRLGLGRAECAVVFVGFAAKGTLGRRIIDGAETVQIHGDEIPVRASIHTIGGFSAHADRDELLAWHRQTGAPERTFLVHGEAGVMERFGSLLDGTEVVMPELHQTFAL